MRVEQQMRIEIRDLAKVYGRGAHPVRALDGVNLEIGAGMFGLLGPNGAGKTTLMRILAGLVRPSGGSVVVAGHDMAHERGRVAAKQMLGYLPQELGLYPDLSARQFVDYLAILKGLDEPAERSRRVDGVLEMVGLGDVADRKLKTYSGGMKRRVGIAQALVNDPHIVIVDEPTAGLDPEERIRFRNLLVDLAADRVVILSTHIVEDIGQTCSDMAVLQQGRVVFRGSPAALIASARGRVWQVVRTDGDKPDHGLIVVSTQHLEEGIQYRVVGDLTAGETGAVPVPPSLEDGYMALMRGRQAGA